MFNVWYILTHLVTFDGFHVGKYTYNSLNVWVYVIPDPKISKNPALRGELSWETVRFLKEFNKNVALDLIESCGTTKIQGQ